MSVSTSHEGVGTALRTLRKVAGMTLADVGKAAGISAPYLSNVENGNMKPSADWVRMVMAVIGKRLDEKAAA